MQIFPHMKMILLYELVKLYQVHKHSENCSKYKNKLRRNGLGRCFNERTFICKQLEDNIQDIERYSIIKTETIY